MTSSRACLPTTPALVAAVLCAALAIPAGARAQAAGGTIVLEGTFTLTIPAPPPSYGTAPAPGAPPVASPYATPAPPIASPYAPAPPIVTVLPPSPPAATPRSFAPYMPPAAAQGDVALAAPRMRRRWGLVGLGTGFALGGYALAISGALSGLTTSSGGGDAGWSFIPVVGPLIQLEDVDNGWLVPLLIVEFGLQTAGFIMAIVGTASRRPVRERRGHEEPAPTAAPTIVPYASSTGAGVAIGGAF